MKFKPQGSYKSRFYYTGFCCIAKSSGEKFGDKMNVQLEMNSIELTKVASFLENLYPAGLWVLFSS